MPRSQRKQGKRGAAARFSAAVRPLFVNLGGRPELQAVLADEFGEIAAHGYSLQHDPTGEMRALAEAIDRLLSAADELTPWAFAEFRDRLPNGATGVLAALRPPVNPGHTLRTQLQMVARAARRSKQKGPDSRSVYLVHKVAYSWEAAGRGWPTWKWEIDDRGRNRPAGYFINHLREVFRAARLRMPGRPIIDKAIKPVAVIRRENLRVVSAID